MASLGVVGRAELSNKVGLLGPLAIFDNVADLPPTFPWGHTVRFFAELLQGGRLKEIRLHDLLQARCAYQHIALGWNSYSAFIS